MYIKYVMKDTHVNASLANDSFGALMNDIKDVLNGEYTSASQFNGTYCDKDASQIVGTIPNRAAVWVNLYHNDAYVSSGDRHMFKNHHSVVSSSDATYNPRVKLTTTNSSNYGFGMTMATHDAANYIWPNYHSGFTQTNDTNPDTNLASTFAGQAFHFFITDKIFFMSTVSSNDISFTFGMLEQEYSAGFDEKLFETNPLWCPTILFKSRYSNLEKDEITGTGEMGMAKLQYVTQSGTSANTIVDPLGFSTTTVQKQMRNNMSYGSWYQMWDDGRRSGQGDSSFNSGIIVDNINIPTIFPNPSVGMPGQVGDAGSSVHKLHPIYYQPTRHYGSSADSSTTQHDTKYGKIEDFYRTTDSVLHTGDVLTDGTNNFRIIRLHHCGSRTHAGNGFAACYAIPE